MDFIKNLIGIEFFYHWISWYIFSSLHFSRSVVSDSLQPHEPQHTRHPCPSPTPGICLNSCSSSWWCVSNIPFCGPLLLLSSIFPSTRVFSSESVLHIRWPKYWSFGISPSNEYSGLISFRIDWNSLQSKGLSRVFSNSTVQKHQFFSAQLSLWSNSPLTSIHDYWKNHSFD